MKHKLLLTWLKSHRTAIVWSFSISVIVVGAITYIIGNTISNSVVRRINLLEVPTLDISIKTFEVPLSGLLVDALDARRPVTGVMVENSPEARPQSGLDNAEVVFEAIAEGGITRFVAFFQAEQPDKIGPVRSVRPHYNDWVMSFDAAIAHAGGSAQGLAEIRNYGIKDLDQFTNSVYYYRDSSRFSPHNLYTSSSQLDALQAKKGYKESKFKGWQFGDGKVADEITADEINVTISSGKYDIGYFFDKNTNEYSRSVGGAPHIDANTNNQITVDNVIIMEVPYSIYGGYYHYNLEGTGKLHVFINGTKILGEWSRTTRTASFRFRKAGKNITLNRGHTWVTAIQPGNSVIHKAE